MPTRCCHSPPPGQIGQRSKKEPATRKLAAAVNQSLIGETKSESSQVGSDVDMYSDMRHDLLSQTVQHL